MLEKLVEKPIYTIVNGFGWWIVKIVVNKLMINLKNICNFWIGVADLLKGE